MEKGKVEKFSLQTVVDATGISGLESAKSSLAFARGSLVDVSGKVRKVGKREGIYRLVIEPGDVPGFVVFADFDAEPKNLAKPKIRKGSRVVLCGRFESFGASAVCLVGCRVV